MPLLNLIINIGYNMKAAILSERKTIEFQELKKPDLINYGAIIRVKGCGLCGSDIVKLKQGIVPEGTVLGHEIVGKIVEINSKNENFKIGDRVAGGHHVPCYKCVYCRNENYSMCRSFKASNIIPGGFSEYVYISEAHLNNTIFKVQDKLSDIEASFVEPVACCLRAVKRANIKAGDNVFIIGLGSIGLLIGQTAKYYGAKICGCDLLDERLELALELGFSQTYKYTTLDETSNSYNLKTDFIGADKVFLSSGSLSSLPLALASIRDGGTIVVFSSVSTSNGVFSNNDIYYRELTVMGSYSPSPQDLSESLDLINNGIIKVGFASEYDLGNINEAIDDTLSNKIIKAYIKIE